MELLMTLVGLLLVLLLFVFGRGLISLYGNYQKISHIPGVIQYFQLFPFKIPFFSYYFALGQYDELERAIEKYGDPETKTLGMATSSGPVVWISDPKLLKEYFITKGSYFEKPDYNIASIFGENVVSAPNNERWKKHFKKFNVHVAVNSCDSLFKTWNKNLETGTFVLNLDDYSNLTLDILAKAGFNIDFGIYSDSADGKTFRHNMEKMQSPLSIILMLIFSKDSMVYQGLAKMTGISHAIQHCSDFLDKIIEERKTFLKNEKFNTDETSDILSLLVDANVKEDLITNNELKSNALILSVAGHETTAKTISWISYHLSKRPDIQKKLWEEVDTVLQGRDPTYDDYQSLPYVNAVLMEALRMNPPVIEMNKFATKNVTLGKFEIPKGTVVHPMFSYVQRREDIWENAKEFKPERFLDPKVKDNFLHNFTFSAFSLGNRQCLGKNFALLEATMMLSKIVQNYELKLLNDESKDPVGAVQFPVNRPTANLKIQISKRKL